MTMVSVWLRDLPESPLDAAAQFYGESAQDIRNEFEAFRDFANYTIVFDPAGHEHRSWRLAAIQELAREFAPGRINAVVGRSDAAVEAALSYLEHAEGVTGQLLDLDDIGAGEVVSSPQ